MSDLPEEGYDLSEMSEDEKDEAIKALGQAYNETQVIAATLHNALVTLSMRLYEGDSLGKRTKTMRLTAHQMELIAQLTFPALISDSSREQMNVDSAFEDIIANLEDEE